MTLRNKLDDIDLRILDIITKNARTPFKDVAVEVGISRAAIHQRVNRMVEMEVITGSGYYVDPKKVDYHTCTFIGIFLDKGTFGVICSLSFLGQVPFADLCFASQNSPVDKTTHTQSEFPQPIQGHPERWFMPAIDHNSGAF